MSERMFQPQPGDCILVWQMAPVFLGVIDWASSKRPCHHCAIVLPPKYTIKDPHSLMLYAYEHGYVTSDPNKPWVYEAWPPRSRKMPWSDYCGELAEWATNWRYRVLRRPPMYAEYWRFPNLTDGQLAVLTRAAEDLLDIKYRMVTEWLWGTPAINCSEFTTRVTTTAGLTKANDFPHPDRLDRTTPYEWRCAIEKRGAELVFTQREF